MSGKGSTPRPYSVPSEDFAASFDRIFGKPQKLCGCEACKLVIHASDCSVHNMPASPNGPCNCCPTDDGPGQEGEDKQ